MHNSKHQVGKFYEPIQSDLLQVGEKIKNLSNEQFPFLGELLTHTLESEGKRLRPAITILTSKFHDNDGNHPTLMAAAVELLHIATLVHDDTVDNADVRRGKATASSLWGEQVAVLLGDYLFATSATFVCDTYNIRVVRRFSETIMELSSGELMELVGAYNVNLTREEYWRRLYNKTASLFCTSAESGAVLSGASDSISQSFREYGYNLGMAFQVVDDILDFEGDAAEIGKPVGNDLLQGTVTLPAIMLLERHPEDNPIGKLFQKNNMDYYLERVVEMIQNSAIISDSYSVASDFCHKAREALADLPDNAYKRSLIELTEYVTARRT